MKNQSTHTSNKNISQVKVPISTVPPANTTKKKSAPIVLKSKSPLASFPLLRKRPIAHTPVGTKTSSDKTRYTTEELKEFETLIYKKLDNARKEFRILKTSLNHSNTEGTDSTSGGHSKVLEDGAETAEKENTNQLAARQLKFITSLEAALIRIKSGGYGVCSVTGKLIPKERLIAVPHTTHSIEAKIMRKD